MGSKRRYLWSIVIAAAVVLSMIPAAAMAAGEDDAKDILTISYSLDGSEWVALENEYVSYSRSVKAPQDWQLPQQEFIWLKAEKGQGLADDDITKLSIGWQCKSSDPNITIHYDYGQVALGESVKVPLELLGQYDEYDHFAITFETQTASLFGFYKLDSFMTDNGVHTDMSFLTEYAGTYDAFTLGQQDGVWYTVIGDEATSDGFLAPLKKLGDVYVTLDKNGDQLYTYIPMGYGVNAYLKLGEDALTPLDNYTYKILGGSAQVSDGTAVSRQDAAQVGGQNFRTLAEAVEAAGSGAAVRCYPAGDPEYPGEQESHSGSHRHCHPG